MTKFVLKQAAPGLDSYYWQLLSSNGTVVASSPSYGRKANCQRQMEKLAAAFAGEVDVAVVDMTEPKKRGRKPKGA